ncbi:MAG: hypothetical protein M1812_002661 [Candelaria pacifica]|nr:MAG: hypothetical protein M1812_002661 [Candelaria pacifica]
MKTFFDKAKVHLHRAQAQYSSGQGQQQQVIKQYDSPSAIHPPTPLDVLRYRYHHGTNLGSVFVLEKWLTGSMYVDGAAGDSELDAINASLKKQGLDVTRAKFEEHWENALSDVDFDWLVNTAHCTTIRLPIGYFTLGPSYCNGTPFAGTPSQVYVNAWAAVKKLVSRARSRGIGILLDFHAVPGGANGDIHSGTSSHQAQLWGNSSNLDLAQRCLVYIAQEAKAMDGLVGIQLCNEAVTGASGMYGWYDSVIGAIGQVDPSVPIYISDAWDLAQALAYSNRKNVVGTGPANGIVADTHKYYTFSDADKAQSPQQIIARVPSELGELMGKEGNVVDHGAAEVIVGEYSCVLDGQTWAKAGSGDKDALVTQFGQVQSKRWQQVAGGSFFWTYKMEWMDGGEWGFAQQTKSGNIPPPSNLYLPADQIQSKLNDAQNQRAKCKNTASSNHNGYWNQASPGQQFQHYRFSDGWDVGFSDALAFFQARLNGLSGPGGDKIGMLDLWVKKRLVDSGQGGSYVWEYEQGLRQGIQDFYSVARI